MRDAELALVTALVVGHISGAVMPSELAEAAVGSVLAAVAAVATLRAAERVGVVPAP